MLTAVSDEKQSTGEKAFDHGKIFSDCSPGSDQDEVVRAAELQHFSLSAGQLVSSWTVEVWQDARQETF